MEREDDGNPGRPSSAPTPRARRLWRGCAAAVLLSGALLGCGSYTKSDFVARADAICASAVRQTRLIAPPDLTGAGRRRLRTLGDYVGRALPVAQSEADQLRALRRPGGSARDQAILSRYLTATDRALRNYRALATAAKRGDAQGVAGAESDLRASPVAALAARYGLRTCGSPGATVP